MTSWRPSNPYKTIGSFTLKILGRVPIEFPATRIFDNCAIIGNESFACFLLETSEGLVLLDCMRDIHAPYIENGIRSLGYDPTDLRYILVTHEHADHYGNAGYFMKKYGTKLYMSEIAERIARDPNTRRGSIDPDPMAFTADGYLEDYGEFICGDTTIRTIWTPGHAEGCMSFIFPVYDEGRPHKAAMWGGSGCPKDIRLAQQLIDSLDKFAEETAKEGVDIALSSHPFQDNTLDRLELLRKLVDGVPNPFIMGEGYRRFELMFRDQYVDQLTRMKNGTYVDNLAEIIAKAKAADNT